MKTLLLTLLFSAFVSISLLADEIVWNGQVSSDGAPTAAIDLTLDKKYQIVVKGTVNLGKWVEAGKPLGEDASYEFNTPSGPQRLLNLKNSNDINLDDKTYNPEHIYKSFPFVAKQSKIHFWVHDLDYSDNSGSFDVQIIRLD